MKSVASILAAAVAFSSSIIHEHSAMALQPLARMPIFCRSQPLTYTLIARSSTVNEAPQTKEESTHNDNLSPFLRGMVDEQRELQMNVGKALDVLRNDYPYFLRRAPDYSIYSNNISLTLPQTPIAASSLPSYQRAIAISRTVLNLFYDPQRSTIQNRMIYDSTRCQIRVSFQAELIPRNVLAPRAYIDGISVYSFDMAPVYVDGERREDGGKIVEHRIEKLLVNGMAAMQPPYWNVLETLAGQQGGALVGAGAWS